MILLGSFSSRAAEHEFRTAPMAIIAQWATLDYSYSFHKNWAGGPSMILYTGPKSGSMFWPAYAGYAVGVHLYGYFNGFSSRGFYWGNHFYFENYESHVHNLAGHYKLEGHKFNMKAGYQLFIRSNINVLLGAGFETRSYSQDDIIDQAGQNPDFKKQSGNFPYIEAKMGFQF